MRDYLQRQGCHWRRSSSSHFCEESIPRIEAAHASSVASSGAVLGDLVSIIPSMLYGFSITGMRTPFPLPKASTPLSDIALADTTHVSLSNLFGIFYFFNLFII